MFKHLGALNVSIEIESEIECLKKSETGGIENNKLDTNLHYYKFKFSVSCADNLWHYSAKWYCVALQ